MVNIPDAGTVCFERSPWRIEPWIRNIFDKDIKFYQIYMEFYFVERVFLLKFVGKKKHASIYGFYSINFASHFYDEFK